MNSDSYRSAESGLQRLSCDILAKLWERWDKMGLDREPLADRIRVVANVIEKTGTGLIAEEDSNIAKLVNHIERHGIEVAKLSKELGLPADDPDPDLGLIKLEKELRDQVEKLKGIKAERMREVLELKTVDEELCSLLCEEPYYVSSTQIPTTAQMTELKHHISKMKSLRTRRFGVFSETKLAIITLLEKLEAEPDTTFERNMVCESDDDFVLSASNLQAVDEVLQKLQKKMAENEAQADDLRKKIFRLMDKLQQSELEKDRIARELSGTSPSTLTELQRILGELEVLKSEKMEQFIKATRSELHEYWDKCHYSQDQRDKFVHLFSDDYTEALLEVHEQEVESLRNYYEANIDLFDKVAKRQDLWKKMLELEQKQKDPTHLLKAKGNTLLVEERERKRVNRLLPKVENELRICMEEYHEQHGRPFLVGGVSYEDFVEYQVQEHALQQEAEKAAKTRAKKQQNFHETIYGSKPKTPMTASAVKRKAAGGSTPFNSSKRPRGNDVTSRSNFLSATRSPFAKSKLPVGGKSDKYGLRPGGAKRKILADKNNDTFMAGPPQLSSTLSSVDQDTFFKDFPQSAATSTFQHTPEQSSTPLKTRAASRSRLATPKSVKSIKSGGVFKTPSGRAPTPGAKSTGKKLTLRSGRPLPFLI